MGWDGNGKELEGITVSNWYITENQHRLNISNTVSVLALNKDLFKYKKENDLRVIAIPQTENGDSELLRIKAENKYCP